MKEELAPLLRSTDELTGQRYCNCSRKNCPMRHSFDRIDSDLPHLLTNLQSLLTCTNLLKSNMPDHDFRILIGDFRAKNHELLSADPPALEDKPRGKTCSTCKEWKLYNEFNKRTRAPDGFFSTCRSCCREYNRARARRAAAGVGG
jgi:hypothetical protein